MSERNYLHYNLEDFLADEAFRKWVIEADRESVVFWQKWLEHHPEKREEVLLAREIIVSLRFDNDGSANEDMEEVLGEVLKGKKSLFGMQVKQLSAPRTTNSPRVWYRIAAVFLLIVLSSVAYIFYNNAPTSPEMVLKENIAGNKSIFTLPDGTTVTLNANSTLLYPAKFEKGQRLVKLTGEAFFKVAHDTANPFVVKSYNIETTAVGTSFNVKAFPEDQLIKVALVTGKVKIRQIDGVNKNNEVYYLLPGEKLTHSLATNLNRKGKFDNLEEIGWKEGVLVFNDTEIGEMERMLERWYGVDISIEGESKAPWNLEGKFVNQGLVQFLEGLKFTHHIQYKFVTNKKIVITLKPE